MENGNLIDHFPSVHSDVNETGTRFSLPDSGSINTNRRKLISTVLPLNQYKPTF